METPLNVVNRALGYLGLAPINSLDDATPEGEAAQTHWLPCYNALLYAHEWSFAKRAIVPALSDYQPLTWDYAYSLPDDFVRKAAVLRPDYRRHFGRLTPHFPEPAHEIMRVVGNRAPLLVTNVASIYVEYISSLTLLSDLTPAALDALDVLLASRLCLTHKRDPQQSRSLMELYQFNLDLAKSIDASSRSMRSMDNSGYNDVRERWGSE